MPVIEPKFTVWIWQCITNWTITLIHDDTILNYNCLHSSFDSLLLPLWIPNYPIPLGFSNRATSLSQQLLVICPNCFSSSKPKCHFQPNSNSGQSQRMRHISRKTPGVSRLKGHLGSHLWSHRQVNAMQYCTPNPTRAQQVNHCWSWQTLMTVSKYIKMP